MKKFGTKEFFETYIKNQLEKEERSHEVLHRIHFSLTNTVFEMYSGKDAYHLIKNLHEACERISKELLTKC